MNNKLIAQPIIEKLEKEILKNIEILKNKNKTPTLATISVDNNSVYLKMKQNKAEKLGIKTSNYHYKKTTEKDLIKLIQQLNLEENIDGILIQRPLPNYLNELNILKEISEEKDIDGLNYLKQNIYLPAVVTAILEILNYYKIDLLNKNITIVNNSYFLGKPLYKELSKYTNNINICNTKTNNIEELSKNSDILILGINQSNFINIDKLKENVVVIDAGYNKENISSLNISNIKPNQKYTPIPKGVGPITILKLFEQVVESSKKEV